MFVLSQEYKICPNTPFQARYITALTQSTHIFDGFLCAGLTLGAKGIIFSAKSVLSSMNQQGV